MKSDLFSFEHKSQPLLERRRYLKRQFRYVFYGIGLLVFSLGLGAVGYRVYGELSWLDAMHNAAMILTGMGAINPMPDAAGIVFESVYAMFSGIVFLSTIAVMFSPFIHRLLHIIHLDESGDS